MLLFDRHRRFRERLSGYIDGQVNGREKAALETHLASCKRCRTELAQLHSVRTILRSLPPVQAPRSFRLTPQQVKRILIDTAERVPGIEVERQGWGVVAPRRAVELALALRQ